MDPLAELKQTFFQECDELLGALESKLQALDEGSSEPDDVNAAFRAIHSIKGGAGAFGCTDLVGFAHEFEAALDHLRSGRVTLEQAPFSLFMRCVDAVADLVGAARSGDEAHPRPDLIAQLVLVGKSPAAVDDKPPASLASALDGLIAQVDAKMGGPAPAAPPPAAPPVTIDTDWDEPAPQAKPGRDYALHFTPGSDLFRRVIEPRVMLQGLPAADIVSISCDLSEVPALEAIDVTDCYLRIDVNLHTEMSVEQIASIFDFTLAADEFAIEVLAPAKEKVAEPEVAPAMLAGLASILSNLDAAPAAAPVAAPPPPAPVAPPVLAVVPTVEAPVAKKPAQPAAPPPPPSRQRQAVSVRVDLERIDRLMNLVGEIVITQSMLVECVRALPYDVYAKTAEGILTLSRQTRELQDHVMAVRAQPVKAVFQRMPRLVRELAETLGKEVKLILVGENTEVDKTIIEELADPLTHMIRNSMDHGVETPEERIAAGKNPEGLIELVAEHRAGRIVISVTDDGRGINREKLLAKAKQRNLVEHDAKLTPEEIDALIFAAGLSTQDAVSDISGRGVGMDVVRRNVESLGGRITVDSEPGRGCRFTLALPLTLAVLEGMLVRCGSDRFVIPISSVIETLHLAKTAIEHLTFGQEILRWRGEVTPLHRLGIVMGCDDQKAQNIIIIAETERGEHIGIAVDEIIGQQQVVVKSLETNYGAVAGASAATILGDGLVALILDIDAMVRLAAEARKPIPELKLVG